MNDKKQKYNFTPKSLTSKNKKNTKFNIHEEIKKNLYQNDDDFRKTKSNQINNKYNKNNNFLTDKNQDKNISMEYKKIKIKIKRIFQVIIIIVQIQTQKKKILIII